MRIFLSAIALSSLILLVNGDLSPLRSSTHGSPHKPRLCIFMVGRGMISIPEAVDLLRDPKLAGEMNFSTIDEDRLNVLLCKVSPEAAHAVKQQIHKQKCKEDSANCFLTVPMKTGFDSYSFTDDFFGNPSFVGEDVYGYTFPNNNNNFEMGFRQLQATFMDNTDDWEELDELIEKSKAKKAGKEKTMPATATSESNPSPFLFSNEPTRFPKESEGRTAYDRMRRVEKESLRIRALKEDDYGSPTKIDLNGISPRTAGSLLSPGKRISLDIGPTNSLESIPRQTEFLRTSRKYRGIDNKDSFCYMISVIQALYHIPDIRRVILELDVEQAKEKNKAGVGALQNIFKHLDRFIHQSDTELRRYGSNAAVDIVADDLKAIFQHQEGTQGDASEVLIAIFRLVSQLKESFKFHRLEVLMEDRPKGFIFSDRWESDRLYQLRLLDYDYTTLQDALDYGITIKAELTLDKSDARHNEFRDMDRNKWVSDACSEHGIPCKIQCIKFTNLEDPGPFVAFHLIRYRAGRDHEPTLLEKPFIYSESINIARKKYRLQAVIVHTPAEKGNAGHYFTITRTNDSKEEWIECNDKKVIVANKEKALSYVTAATLLIYAQVETDGAVEDEGKEAVRRLMMEQKFIERDTFGANLIRLAAQQAVSFSHEFKPTVDQSKYYVRYQPQYEKSNVRQALARHSTYDGEDFDDIIASIAEEQKEFSKEVLLETYPTSFAAVKKAVEEANGCLEAAQIALAKKLKK